MLNKLLDASIYYSFDKSGYLRHAKSFDDAYEFIQNGNALVTGGTSGIGQAVSRELANHGVNVVITGRNQTKGEMAAKEHELINFTAIDMVDWDEFEGFVNKLVSFDYIVLNAGGMPQSFSKNDYGIESQFASQLYGHYYLLKELSKKGKLKKGTKVVWVTSGGMYLSNLDLEKITQVVSNYDRVGTYANVKRAQVTLLPFFKEQFPDQIVTAMHPGWVETPGLSSGIPKFNEKMKGKLRSPKQGADTILWLLGTKKSVESGGLYFDRKKVKKHLFWFTKKSDKKMAELSKSLLALFFNDL